MDSGPFRAPQPADRRPINRPEQPPRQPKPIEPDEPEEQKPVVPIEDEPKIVNRPTVSPTRATIQEKLPKRLKLKVPILAVIIVIVLALVGWFAWSSMQSNGTAIDKSKYQAVFFTNGQVYFGKLSQTNDQYMKLTDIYYLQAQTDTTTDSENPQQTTTDQKNVQLIKLGDEIHGPEDEMTISKEQVLFYENLKTDGKVAQSIAKFKK